MGIEAAIIGSAVVGAVGANQQAKAAKSAAGMQAAAADRAMQQEREMYEQSREDLAPYREQGYTALQDIAGMKPFLTSQFGPEDYEIYADPAMAFRMKYGTKATERAANVGGGLLSGNTLRSLTEFGQDLASTEYQNAFTRKQQERNNIYNILGNIAGMGQQSVNTGVQAGQNFAGQQTGLLTGQAAAQAGGQVGAANAYAGALSNIGSSMFLPSLLQSRTPGVTPASAVANYGLTGGAPPMGITSPAGAGINVSPSQAGRFFSAG